MNTKKIDILNIGFIAISLFLAFKLPFELFLFSYVILGPLHYLTEINWLNERNYFVGNRKWIWVFVLLCALVSIPAFLKLPLINGLADQVFIKWLSGFIAGSQDEIILIMFIFAIAMVYFKKQQYLLPALLVSIGLALLIHRFIPFPLILAGVFLPTIIHVYLFTLLFMIYGALNNKSKAGILGSIILLLSPLIILIIRIDPSDYVIAASAKTSYLTSRFSVLNIYLAKLFTPSQSGKFDLYSASGIRIQVFIAFCYTYHYLNWFSKTSLIGWAKTLSRSKLALLLLIWAGSVLLYWYNYKTGYMALFFLSLVHVVLEFPLNITSIKGLLGRLGLH